VANQIIPTAEPFFFPASSTKLGCLLIHGFTGAPKEMRWMGEYLSSQGYPSLGVRLAGHATHPEDMVRTRYTDWLASVEDGYAMLRVQVERVVMIGLSMGGVLALLASTYLETVGVVAISTPYSLPEDPRLRFINPLSWFRPFIPKSKLPPGSGWFDREAWKEHVSYPTNPVRSIGELNRLLAEMRAALPRVRVPTLLIHSKDDGYVLPRNAEQIFAGLGTADKEKLYVTGSGHVVTKDAARQQAFEATLKFIRRVEAK
jgi:carboxylesterase